MLGKIIITTYNRSFQHTVKIEVRLGYRLALADDAINSDLYAIRHKQNNNGDQTKRHTDVVNKKKKR